MLEPIASSDVILARARIYGTPPNLDPSGRQVRRDAQMPT
jgi:hypothetical protein